MYLFWQVLQEQQLIGASGLFLMAALAILATQTDRHLRKMVARAVIAEFTGILLVGSAGVAAVQLKTNWSDTLSNAAALASLLGTGAVLYGLASLLKSSLIAFMGFPKRPKPRRELDALVLRTLRQAERRGAPLTFRALKRQLDVHPGELYDALERLRKKGWVRQEVNATAPCWPVTPAGQAALHREGKVPSEVSAH